MSVFINRTGDKVSSPNGKEQLCEAVEYLSAALAAERAENARLRKSLTFFAARFLAVAPRHEGSGEATP